MIVGAGPTGLSAALFLAERGVSVRIVEQHDGLSRHSKAFGVNPRTLSLLASTGVTERLLAQGHRVAALNIWRHGRRLFQLDLAKTNHRFPFMLIHAQAKSEAVLADALKQRGIDVEFNTRLTDIQTGRDSVVTHLERADGQTERVDGRFALGADGAHSTVRQRLDIGFPGDAYPELWQIIDLRLDTNLAGEQGHLVLDDQGAVFFIRLEADVWRVAGNVPSLLAHLPVGTQAGEVLWESDFRISHRVVEQFRVGCVAVAGDAAHLHSPLGGRGMNLGVEDAYVFAQLVAEKHLDHYDDLRRPVVQSVVHRVARLTQIARGKSFKARLARWLSPLLGTALPLAAGSLRKWVLGLDHEVWIPNPDE